MIFKKTFLTVALLVVVLFCSTEFTSALEQGSFEIAEVKTAGNITISTSKIISRTFLRETMRFDPSLADKDIKKIAEIPGVEYAYYNLGREEDGKLILTYVISEKKLIGQIQFTGNKKVSDTVLLKQVGFKKGDYLDKFSVKEGRQRILDYYHKKGFAFANCQVDMNELANGRVIYQIAEGLKVRILSTKFSGNKVFEDKVLKNGIKSLPRKLYLLPNYFSQEKLKEDISKIEKKYHEKGCINAKVSAAKEFSQDKSSVDIVFNIKEGKAFIVDDIQIAGNDAIESLTLLSGTKLRKGWLYSDEKADYDAKKIREQFQQIGFVDVKVKKNRQFVADGRIKVVYNIDQGERFRIGKVNITGNTDTYDKVIRRVLDEYEFVPGKWYNAKIAKGSGSGSLEKNVQRATYAQSALITPQNKKDNKADALVSIAEGQTGMVMFGAGIGSNDGLVGQVVYEQRNFDILDTPTSWDDFWSGNAFKGAGQKMRLSLEPGTEFSRYSLSFTEPYLNDKPIQFDSTISSFVRGRESYDEKRVGGYFSFRKRFRDGWYRGLAIRLERVNVSGTDDETPLEIVDYKGSEFLTGVKLFTGKSTVDSRFDPTEGYVFDIDLEAVTGGDTFSIFTVTNRWYKTLYEDLAERKTVLETKVKFATILGDAPPYEKFYAGGTGSIRGFGYRGVSTRGDNPLNPSADKDPIGSDWMAIANAEVAVPIGQGRTISALFFTDAGLIDTGGVRASAGMGIQIMVPQWFGPVPMRFELARPMLKDDQDQTQTFSFTIGRLF